MKFKDLKLHPGILKALEEAGYETPTPIQEKAIPEILARKDLRASAQTGTGKTAAFILPSLNLLTVPATVRAAGPRILVLVPTRELADQVAAQAVKYSKHLPRTKTVCIYGGAPYPIQNRELSRPYEILVATPGRLIDHLERKRIDLSRVEMLILDEADRMLDMGFIEPVEYIASLTPPERQTLMFSATLKGSVMNLSHRLLKNPTEVSIEPEEANHENIEQRLHYVDNIGHKERLLDHLLSDPDMNQAIVFTSTKWQADQLAENLIERDHPAATLHGDMSQRQRNRTIAKLRMGEIRILVATDVAARGIDIKSISHVINFDLPSTVEDYVHRIGRTGRAGAKGIAMSFAAPKEMQLVKRIEQFTGISMNCLVIPGFEPKIKPVFSPAKKPGGSFGGRYGRSKPSNRSQGPNRSGGRSFSDHGGNSGGGGGGFYGGNSGGGHGHGDNNGGGYGGGSRGAGRSANAGRGAGRGTGAGRSGDSEPSYRSRPNRGEQRFSR